MQDEQGAFARIEELCEAVKNSQMAFRVGEALNSIANEASEKEQHRIALSAAKACVALSPKFDARQKSWALGRAL